MRYGVIVVYNFGSNMKFVSGVMFFEKFLNVGVNIGFGIDGSVSNNNFDMFEEMKFVVLFYKVYNFDFIIVDVRMVFRMVM